jgi:CubicO group peptidase (beta-lactamase class C family)
MRRRSFLLHATRASLAAPLIPLLGCAHSSTNSTSATATKRNHSAALAKLTPFLQQSLPTWMRENKVPGLSITLVNDSRPAWSESFGVKDVSTNEPVDSATIFQAASMSKPVFAYVVLKLCEKGVLDLDTPVTKYTTERWIEDDPRLDLITPRHILSHTSGFQNWRENGDGDHKLKIHFTPGSQYKYSGEGYNYLQTILTHLLGKSIQDYMRENLFEPFGMKSSIYLWNDKLTPRIARGHDENGKPIDHKPPTVEAVTRYGSAGALLTTADDYVKFLAEVIHPKPADKFRLKPETISEMLRPHIKLEGGRYPASWALGWQIFHNDNRDFIYHGGDNKGFHCCAVASVPGQSGFVAMTNGEKGPEILKNILTAEPMQTFLAA